MSKSFIQAIDCEAKASFNSTMSISSIFKLALLSAFFDAFIGPRPINSGGQPCTAIDLIFAKISRLFAFA